MKVRLYLDEDTMDADLIQTLRTRGVDLQTAYEAGLVRREDHELLAYAAQ